MINIHFSLLPRWRGAAPVERAILAGDADTGVCIMDVEPTLDTGAVYARTVVPISHTATAESLTVELSEVGGDLLVKTLTDGLSTPEPQEGHITYAEKISADEGRIDWDTSSDIISRQVRALRAFTWCDGARVRIHEVKSPEITESDTQLGAGQVTAEGRVGTGDGSLVLVRVQPEGKPIMDAIAWLRGRSQPTRFTSHQ